VTTPWLTIIGVTEAGIAALPPAHQALIATAETVLGPERLFAQLRGENPSPQPSPSRGGGARSVHVKTTGSTSPLVGEVGAPAPGEGALPGTASLIPWRPPLATMLEQVLARRGRPTIILATGDPNWFGIAATLARSLDASEIAIHPAPSSFQLAAARLGWPLQYLVTLSLHGRPVETLHPHLTPGNRLVMLTADRHTLPAVKALLVARGYGRSRLVVLEDLGGAAERIVSGEAESLAHLPGDFYVLGLDCVAVPGAPLLSSVPGLPDTAFASDGQLTKREVRAATLARLAPVPGGLLWDVGAGMGSIAIEWLRAARNGRAIAFEADPARCAMIAGNAAALGVPALAIVPGQAPESLAGQPTPDAIFLGGAVASEALFSACWAALPSGGRLVANGVTAEAETALISRWQRFGGELVRIDIARLEPIGESHAFRPRLPVTQWAVTKP
jgi:precorrin-6Y C5,15-methyltransferase (decarboxylating)